jgi:hypothetical protein
VNSQVYKGAVITSAEEFLAAAGRENLCTLLNLAVKKKVPDFDLRLACFPYCRDSVVDMTRYGFRTSGGGRNLSYPSRPAPSLLHNGYPNGKSGRAVALTIHPFLMRSSTRTSPQCLLGKLRDSFTTAPPPPTHID